MLLEYSNKNIVEIYSLMLKLLLGTYLLHFPCSLEKGFKVLFFL